MCSYKYMGEKPSNNMVKTKKKKTMNPEFILMCNEGDEAKRDEMIAVLLEKYPSAVIVPGVIKRTH